MSNYRLSLILFLVLEVLVYYLLRDMDWVFLTLLVILVLYLGILFYFSLNLKYNFYLKSINNAKKGYVILGFDDGPDPVQTPIILDILKENDAKAIFFLIGENAEKHPRIVKQIVSEGHLIGNHSQHHYYTFGFLSYKKVRKEILNCTEIIEKISERKSELFRPPFGVINPIISKVVRRHKLKVIGWNLRSYDVANKNSERMLNRLMKKSRSGSSILLHDRVKNTIEILPELLKNLKDKGLTIYPELEY